MASSISISSTPERSFFWGGLWPEADTSGSSTSFPVLFFDQGAETLTENDDDDDDDDPSAHLKKRQDRSEQA